MGLAVRDLFAAERAEVTADRGDLTCVLYGSRALAPFARSAVSRAFLSAISLNGLKRQSAAPCWTRRRRNSASITMKDEAGEASTNTWRFASRPTDFWSPNGV